MKSKGAVNADSAFRVKLADNTTYPLPGRILVVDRGVDNQSGTIKVRIQFPNPKKQLVDGMSCMLQVLNNQSGEQVIIPYKAVVEQMGEYFVFVAKDTVIQALQDSLKKNPKADSKPKLIAVEKKVQVGQTIGPQQVIKSGLVAGEKIVTDGVQSLHDGSPITTANKVGPGGGGRRGQ